MVAVWLPLSGYLAVTVLMLTVILELIEMFVGHGSRGGLLFTIALNPDGTAMKLAQIRRGLVGGAQYGLIFRVSSISHNAPEAYALQARFLVDLYRSLAPAGRRTLLGVSE